MFLKAVKKTFILFIFFLLGYNFAFGQILNIEKARLDSLENEKPYRINFETKFNFYNRSASAEDQARFATITNELNAVFAPNKTAYIVLGKLAYTENNGQSILNNGYLHARSHFNHKNRWSQEAFGQVQYDNFRGLSERYLLGASIRWRAVKSNHLMAAFATGPMFENEIWQHPTEEGVENVHFLKLSTYMILRWDITKTVNFNTIFYYQVGYDPTIDKARNRLSSSSNINIKISKFLSFNTSIEMAYEDKPIIPITKFIYGVENGLRLTF